MTVSVPAEARETCIRTVVGPSWVVLGALVALAAAVDVGTLPPAVVYAPFALSVVVLGLPHGAVDHLVPGRLADGVTPRSMLAVGGVYAVLMTLYAVLWVVAPTLSFVLFVLLTWFHWGQGDVYAVLAITDADHLPTTVERLLALVVRGGLPMLVPLVAFPDRYRAVVSAAVRLFGADVAALAPLFTPDARLAVGGSLLGLSVIALVAGAWRVVNGARRDPWLLDAGEVVILWAYFALVPPVLAVGAYFCAWHALRHVARLLLADDPAAESLAAGDVTAAIRRFARDAAPLTAAALSVFVLLYLLVPSRPDDGAELLGLYLVGIALLTLPHVAVVTWMDVRQGVWRLDAPT